MGKECSYVNATSAGSPAGSAQDHNRGELLHLMKRALSKLNPEIPTDLDGLRHYCSFDAAGHFVRRSSDEDTSVPRASEVSDDVASRQQDSEPIALGGSPMLEASVTVVNQGKTRRFFNSDVGTRAGRLTWPIRLCWKVVLLVIFQFGETRRSRWL